MFLRAGPILPHPSPRWCSSTRVQHKPARRGSQLPLLAGRSLAPLAGQSLANLENLRVGASQEGAGTRWGDWFRRHARRALVHTCMCTSNVHGIRLSDSDQHRSVNNDDAVFGHRTRTQPSSTLRGQEKNMRTRFAGRSLAIFADRSLAIFPSRSLATPRWLTLPCAVRWPAKRLRIVLLSSPRNAAYQRRPIACTQSKPGT